MKTNPFSLTFGKQPPQYISRYESTDMILSAFREEIPVSQIYLIEGLRGSGKTVLMTTISQELREDKTWIVVDLNAAGKLLNDLAHRLYDSCKGVPKLLDKGFNLSVAGVGLGIGSDTYQDEISVINDLLDAAKKKKKRILITIDEVVHSQDMREFASQFQIWLREDYPVFLLMTGLYENIYAIQNDVSLTFLLRSPKVRLTPLSMLQIKSQYEAIFQISEEEAIKLAELTKGYAFAFQALGMLYWEYGKTMELSGILSKFDELLEDFVYTKIWSSLSESERRIIHCIDTDKVKVAKILEVLSMSAGTFSKYRDGLVKSGLLVSETHGYVGLSLPRFYEVTRFMN